MRGVKCAHDMGNRSPSGNCRACAREASARYRSGHDRAGEYTPPRLAGAHPSRPLSLDVATDPKTGVVREPRVDLARNRTALGGGSYKTTEGGGSPRAWVICRCALCASSRMTFSDGTERRQDGERDRLHPVHYRRHPALTSTREEVVIDADGEDRRVVVTTTDFPPRWELIEETADRGNVLRPAEHPAA